MLNKITLLDINNDLGDAWILNKRNIPIKIVILKKTDVQNIELEEGLALVSPANSLSFMDGGIDAVYMDMFSDIERKVKATIKKNGKLTFLGRYFLPIGEAVVVPTGINSTYLISAPTMFLPLDVSETHNAYHATYAAMKAALTHGKINHIVLPGMATGIGRIPIQKAAEQMWDAIEDALSNKVPKYSEKEIVQDQPPIYAFKEYFETYGAHDKIRKIIGFSSTAKI